MDWHIIAIALFVVLNAVLGFFVTRLYNQMDRVNERLNSLEVSHAEGKADLKYIRDAIDDIKKWFTNGQKGPL